MSEAIADAIEQAATEPKRVKTDRTEVEAHSLAEMVEADRYLAAKAAAAQPNAGLRFTKLLPPGAV